MRKTCAKPVKNRLDTGPHSEPPTGIDPVTSFLPRTRSTTELGGQRVNTLPEDFRTNKSASSRSPAWGLHLSPAPRTPHFPRNSGAGGAWTVERPTPGNAFQRHVEYIPRRECVQPHIRLGLKRRWAGLKAGPSPSSIPQRAEVFTTCPCG